MSFKVSNIKSILLTTGGTVSIPNGGVTTNFYNIDSCTEYSIVGTQSLIANFIVAMTGTPAENTLLKFHWTAAATPGAFSVSILGSTIPAYLLSKRFTVVSHYKGAAWTNTIVPDLNQSQGIDGDCLVDGTVSTAKIGSLAVTDTRLASNSVIAAKIASNAVEEAKINALAVTEGKIAALAVTEGKIGALAVTEAKIGALAVTEAKIGALAVTAAKIGAGAVEEAKIASLAVTSGKIGAKAVTLDKLDSVGFLASKYTDTGTTAVTSEETLFTYTLTGGTIDADGDGIEIIVAGTTGANAHTKTIRVKFAGNTYSTNSVTTAPNGLDWFAQIRILRAGATAAVGKGSLVVSTNHEGIAISKAGVTWANNNDVLVTGQNGTANINDIVVSLVTVNLIR